MNRRLRLNCERCGEFTTYHTKTGDPSTVARCDKCGKKHSDRSVFMVDTDRRYTRDETGTLTEKPY